MSKKGANNTYFGDILEGITSLWAGLKVTFRHFIDARKRRPVMSVEDASYFQWDSGIVTTEYPKEAIPVPDNGRYRLHNEMDDCIVCDLCAKICPVNCIEIEPVKSMEEIGKTSDGTTKRLYAARFDIDMAKCCYCGLCTTVCPTECLTMTKTYDYSEYDISNMIYHFTNLTPGEAEEKKKLYEEAIKAKAAEKEKAIAASKGVSTAGAEEKSPVKKVPAKPIVKPAIPAKSDHGDKEDQAEAKTAKPVVKPVIKPKITQVPDKTSEPGVQPEGQENKAPKPVMKPVIKSKPKQEHQAEGEPEKKQPASQAKPIIKPVIKPRQATEVKADDQKEKKAEQEDMPESKPKPKPVIKPIIPKRKDKE